jgi:hypothetical protein
LHKSFDLRCALLIHMFSLESRHDLLTHYSLLFWLHRESLLSPKLPRDSLVPLSTNKRSLWFLHMRWNKPQCELFYIANFAIIRLLTLWDLLDASTSSTLCASIFGHLPYGAAATVPMYNNEFQWLLKDRFHIIYHIVATSVKRNSYRIIRVGIYTHFSSKSISRVTMLPLISLVFQEDNVSH